MKRCLKKMEKWKGRRDLGEAEELGMPGLLAEPPVEPFFNKFTQNKFVGVLGQRLRGIVDEIPM